MSAAKRFFDTNILLYLLSADDAKAETAEREMSAAGIVSVQVLNEFAAVATRKLLMPIAEIREILSVIHGVCHVEPISLESHDLGLQMVETYRFALYDAMIVASALLAGCGELITEDLQHGQTLEGRLTIRNPFLRSR